MKAAYALKLVATTQMRSFDDADRETYAGIESEDPLIGEADGYVLIVDGRHFRVLDIANRTASYFTPYGSYEGPIPEPKKNRD